MTRQKYNRKTSGGCEFITKTRYLKKVGMDLIDFGEEGVFLVVGIDYFTRRVWGKIIKSKQGSEIFTFLKDLGIKDKNRRKKSLRMEKNFVTNK